MSSRFSYDRNASRWGITNAKSEGRKIDSRQTIVVMRAWSLSGRSAPVLHLLCIDMRTDFHVLRKHIDHDALQDTISQRLVWEFFDILFGIENGLSQCYPKRREVWPVERICWSRRRDRRVWNLREFWTRLKISFGLRCWKSNILVVPLHRERRPEERSLKYTRRCLITSFAKLQSIRPFFDKYPLLNISLNFHCGPPALWHVAESTQCSQNRR